jgi:hypothetical protein
LVITGWKCEASLEAACQDSPDTKSGRAGNDKIDQRGGVVRDPEIYMTIAVIRPFENFIAPGPPPG